MKFMLSGALVTLIIFSAFPAMADCRAFFDSSTAFNLVDKNDLSGQVSKGRASVRSVKNTPEGVQVLASWEKWALRFEASKSGVYIFGTAGSEEIKGFGTCAEGEPTGTFRLLPRDIPFHWTASR